MQKDLFKILKKAKLWFSIKIVSKNQKEVLKKLNKKLNRKEKLNVIFYIFDETKWKAQSLYELLDKSKYFAPCIFVARNSAKSDNFDYLSKEKTLLAYDYFKRKNMRAFLVYDFNKNQHIPFKNMPICADIIIYCNPWNIPKIHNPLKSSKYALTAYIPYSTSVTKSDIEYDLEFHNLVEKHYVMNEDFKNNNSKKALNNGKNLVAVGNIILDYFYLNKNKTYENKNYVIYAPHYSVDDKSILNWGTFFEFGEFILRFAKKHPEFNWIFKPHPALKGYLLKNTNYTKKEQIEYWQEWEKIGKICDFGDYLDLFMESKMLISDCGSFKVEYFMTQKPQIHLKSPRCKVEYTDFVEKINKTSYTVQTAKGLETILSEVLIGKDDYKKPERISLYNELNLGNCYCAENIVKDLEKTILS